MPISEETLASEPSYETLHNKHRGELAELAFMRKAASRGYAVSKPWGDCERYDFVVRAGKVFWRVQVKSVRAKSPRRPHYSVKATNWLKLPYSPEDIDFLVAYIFPSTLGTYFRRPWSKIGKFFTSTQIRSGRRSQNSARPGN